MNHFRLIVTVMVLLSAETYARFVEENQDAENLQPNYDYIEENPDLEEHTRDKRVSRDSRQFQTPHYVPFQHIGYPPEFYQSQFYNPYFNVNGLKFEEAGQVGAGGPAESTVAPESTPSEAQVSEVDTTQSSTTVVISTEETTTVTESSEEGVPDSGPALAPAPPAKGLAQYCKKARGQSASPFSCKRFINCWDGQATEQECGSGLLYSEENGCDWPYNVKCNGRPLNDEPNPRICDYPHRRYNNPQNCSEFFVCDNRRLVKFGCPDGLHYNFEAGVCDFPYRAQCQQARYRNNRKIIDDAALKFYNQQSGGRALLEQEKCEPNKIIMLSKNCSRAALCKADGTYQFINCSGNSIFDKLSHKCVSDGSAVC